MKKLPEFGFDPQTSGLWAQQTSTLPLCYTVDCSIVLNITVHLHAGVPKKTDPLVYFDDNFGKYGPILTIFSLFQQEIHDTQKSGYFRHLTFIMLPLYPAKQTLMLVSMRIFLDHAANQISMYSNG